MKKIFTIFALFFSFSAFAETWSCASTCSTYSTKGYPGGGEFAVSGTGRTMVEAFRDMADDCYKGNSQYWRSVLNPNIGAAMACVREK